MAEQIGGAMSIRDNIRFLTPLGWAVLAGVAAVMLVLGWGLLVATLVTFGE